MSNPQPPEIFQIPIDRIDLPSLPPKTDATAFEQAVITHYALSYGAKGFSAAVVVSGGCLRVVAVPQAGIEPKAYLLGLLNHGYLEDALPGLEAMFAMVDDPDIAYNYGVALSELGKVEESLAPLKKCLAIDPSFDNAAIALGVSYSKLRRFEEAEEILKTANKIKPDNALIKQNLAGTLARSGKLTEALPIYRQAVSLAPGNGAALMGLAQCLNSIDDPDHQKESLKVYKQVVQKFPDAPFAEAAKAILNKAGQADLRKPVEGGYRPDAVEYMIGAIKEFRKLPKEQVGRITLEIGMLGQNGLSINDPSKRYSLTNLDGDFSGLQLLCYMHAGMQLFDPRIDTGTGLAKEYEIAKGLAGK